MTKFYLLQSDGYCLTPVDVPAEQLTIIPYNAAIKLPKQHIADIAAELGLPEWFSIKIDRAAMTAETSGGRTIKWADVPKNHLARVDCNWIPISMQIYAGKETEALASVWASYENSRKPQEADPAFDALKGLTLAQIRQKEKAWDNLYNEGGEGYNPYRLPRLEAAIDPLD
ncbi:hypothetical protein [Conchiformibius steedae]|uniref:hypothetical protein n=1 Tax=Conchiformibius steedae TaxID=153493 RepID=UPI0026EFFE4E|nr:hypothetical protein [Conchiformibius steedae]